MTSDPKPGGGCTGAPDEPHEKGDVYGGVWAGAGKHEDWGGQGDAPRAPDDWKAHEKKPAKPAPHKPKRG